MPVVISHISVSQERKSGIKKPAKPLMHVWQNTEWAAHSLWGLPVKASQELLTAHYYRWEHLEIQYG